MKTETWVRLAAIGVCAVTAGMIGYVVLRYLAGILLPFFAAAVIASVLRPAASRLHAHTRIPEKAGGTVLILAAVILIIWALRSARFGRAKKKNIRRKVTRTSKAGEAIRALIAKTAALVAFELHYRAHRHTPQGIYVYAVRACRAKRIPRKKHESPGAYMRRLHGMLIAQGEKSDLETLAHMLDGALYGGIQPHLERSEADALSAQIRAIAAVSLIKIAKDR